ncbi:Rrf2 family transcriptional regulator [Pedobacter rhizosphaerae]|uniref:Transcriptional regulator, BadM/Rrf2 family n=1 Tax=Pedobacter rhizosphaerae TaxID=390241 RepID=A0A1H9K106_9SPHI|nr:Rrf2 family transcriptional regulator [Pedobacter rhizosphaerae]SEQ92603.1 transcriptional regulator, BadM/Rrf2 family [Pedobacter rhizosphaerae]
MNNSRFPISLHILTLLDQMKGQYVNSDLIAGSININPVLVRKEIINLRKHGFVESREGKGGGTTLAKKSADINLADVYLAVKDKSFLGESKNQPNPKCPVGRQINTHLKDLYQEVEDTLLKSLGNQTLADFTGKFK